MIQESANAPPLYPATFEDYGMAAMQSTSTFIWERQRTVLHIKIVDVFTWLLNCWIAIPNDHEFKIKFGQKQKTENYEKQLIIMIDTTC